MKTQNHVVSLEDIENEVLFELEKVSEQTYLPQEVVEFLKTSRHPWRALGKNLTEFLEDFIHQIPTGQRKLGKLSSQCYLENEDMIIVRPGAVVEPGAFIAGPAYIDTGATVRHGAYIRGSVYIGPKSIVGHTTECKGSLLLFHSCASHFNYVGDSILGAYTNLGAGTKLANLKFDNSTIKIKTTSGKMDSGLKKMGAILGNRAQTGCNSVTNPGTILLKNASLLPNATALGIIGTPESAKQDRH